MLNLKISRDQVPQLRLCAKSRESTRLAGLGAVLVIIFIGATYSSRPSADSRQSTVDADGTVYVPAFSVPLSRHMSQRAKDLYVAQARDRAAPFEGRKSSISEFRKAVDDYYRPLVERGKALYPVQIRERTIGGVPTEVVTPKQAIAARNHARVLINLHGGSMMVGGGLGGQAESIPIASIGRIKVVSVNYRMAPEYKFPAASEDVAAVYRELLREYKPENIGIYGCSAGGWLTAASVTWFQSKGLPSPGAIGVFCHGAQVEVDGDSRYTAAILGSFGKGRVPAPNASAATPAFPSYYTDADLEDPLVSPVVSDGVLSRFPPTLLIAGSRDPSMSSVVYTHSRLVKAGIDADLHVWDGMWHTFLFEMDMPEAIEAYDVIVKFFDRHLGK